LVLVYLRKWTINKTYLATQKVAFAYAIASFTDIFRNSKMSHSFLKGRTKLSEEDVEGFLKEVHMKI
jgi:hypothetical protein